MINKTIYVIDTIKTAPMNENDKANAMSMCKDYLQQFYDLANENMPKTNSEVREIMEILSRIRRQAPNESDKTLICNLNPFRPTITHA